jgi:hypothetical protein
MMPHSQKDILDTRSRLNFGKPTPVDHNLHVKNVGVIHPQHTHRLLRYYDDENYERVCPPELRHPNTSHGPLTVGGLSSPSNLRTPPVPSGMGSAPTIGPTGFGPNYSYSTYLADPYSGRSRDEFGDHYQSSISRGQGRDLRQPHLQMSVQSNAIMPENNRDYGRDR